MPMIAKDRPDNATLPGSARPLSTTSTGVRVQNA